MTSSLDQLKKFTVVVADTGEFDGNFLVYFVVLHSINYVLIETFILTTSPDLKYTNVNLYIFFLIKAKPFDLFYIISIWVADSFLLWEKTKR